MLSAALWPSLSFAVVQVMLPRLHPKNILQSLQLRCNGALNVDMFNMLSASKLRLLRLSCCAMLLLSDQVPELVTERLATSNFQAYINIRGYLSKSEQAIQWLELMGFTRTEESPSFSPTLTWHFQNQSGPSHTADVREQSWQKKAAMMSVAGFGYEQDKAASRCQIEDGVIARLLQQEEQLHSERRFNEWENLWAL